MGLEPVAAVFRRNPIAGIAGCCARAASGHIAAPPKTPRKFRRFMLTPWLCTKHPNDTNEHFDRALKLASKPLPQCTANVRCGSKADKPSQAKIHLCPLLPQ